MRISTETVIVMSLNMGAEHGHIPVRQNYLADLSILTSSKCSLASGHTSFQEIVCNFLSTQLDLTNPTGLKWIKDMNRENPDSFIHLSNYPHLPHK